MYVEHKETAAQLGMIETVVSWCDAVQGKIPLRQALSAVAKSLGAQVIVMSRASRHADGISQVVGSDLRVLSARTPVSHSFAHSVLGAYAGKAQIGSVWSGRGNEDQADVELERFQRLNRLRELIVLPFDAQAKHLDFLEIHFEQTLDSSQQAALNMLAASLAKTWQNRQPGVFTSALPAARNNQNLRTTPNVPIMSFENPARLSRAEYRVCASLNRGLTTEELCAELNISKTTLRTHLRNIYSKTNSDGLPQLLYALVSAQPFAHGYRATG